MTKDEVIAEVRRRVRNQNPGGLHLADYAERVLGFAIEVMAEAVAVVTGACVQQKGNGMIELGSTVKDRITGFAGVVTGKCQYLTGCSQALVAPRLSHEGSFQEPHWFDEQRLEVDTSADIVALDNGPSPGFDKEPPKR